MDPQWELGGGGGSRTGIFTFLLRQPVAVAVVAAVVALCFLSRRAADVAPRSSEPRGKQAPPNVPSWLPFVGHAPQMMLNLDGFLCKLRDRYCSQGVFSVCVLGRLHHFVCGPSLASSLVNRPRTTADGMSNRLLISNFDLSEEDAAQYGSMHHDVDAALKHLYSDPGLSDLVQKTLGYVKEYIADLVTFNSSPIDQMNWEREAGARVVEDARGESFVEADLADLTRNFIAGTANRALFGEDLVDNFPDMWPCLWSFDKAFMLLAVRVPSWLPWPKSQRARAARARMLSYLREFNTAIDKHDRGQDPGHQWQKLDGMSSVMRARIATFRKHRLPLQARASCDLGLAWAMNANANQLVFWLLFELYRDPALLEQVRDEIAPYVKVTQPRNDFGSAVWLPPVLEHVDLDGLLARCPRLKAAYIESLRVYTGSWTMRWLTEDVMLTGNGGKANAYLLRKGSYAHVPQEMYQLDAAHFPNPNEWHHERHLKETADEAGRKTLVADMGAMRPYGGGPNMCKGRAFALRELLLYSAIIISFFDMKPPEGQTWETPKTYKLAASKHPKKPVKAWIRRRKLPDASGEGVKQESRGSDHRKAVRSA